jgi:type IV pilus assembly protein PilX
MNQLNTKLGKQRGVVLFIALIALVVMSLAAVALIRSVDTNTLIAGNLAFKQSALVSSDRGAETALAWLDAASSSSMCAACALGADLNADNSTNADNGYYATYLTPNLEDPAVLKASATWDEAKTAYAVAPDIASGTGDDGNNIRYIVQRMCRQAAAPSADICLFGQATQGNGSKIVKDHTKAGAIISSQESPVYRITVKVTGPKSTVSYAQTYVY